MCANREVDINFSFKEWKYRGCANPHGYGFAWYSAGKLRIHKDAASLWEEQDRAAEAIRNVRSRIFIGHVRFKRVGPQDGKNTHPFGAEFRGRDFAFAHNGTVKRIKKRELGRRNREGDTDSEHAFLWLLEKLEDVPAEEFASRLKELADEVRGLGRFNFLMSDGETLWAYADHSLHYLERTPPYDGVKVRLRKEGYEIELARIKALDERAVLIATKPLTEGEAWTKLGTGELLVVRDGQIRQRLSRVVRTR
jgi:glutamine amidotransferase